MIVESYPKKCGKSREIAKGCEKTRIFVKVCCFLDTRKQTGYYPTHDSLRIRKAINDLNAGTGNQGEKKAGVSGCV